MASSERIFELLDTPEQIPEVVPSQKAYKLNGKIEFKNVWLAYEENNYVLKDISFSLLEGESLAIVGATGSGKTTLINALCRFYEINKGDIIKQIDGISINKFSDLKNIIKNNSNFNFLAGGTDLSLTVTKERKEIPFIIDLKEVKELDFIKLSKNYLEIGAATPLIKFENEIKRYYPDFYSVLKRYGSVQIRNVGTIGGNIATASPIGDSLPILLSLNAEVLLESFNGRKVLPINNFFIDYRKTKLKKTEFIRSIKIPLYKKNIFKAYKISKRFDDDISSVCGSFNFKIDNNKIKEVYIAYGGMAAIPKRAKACEKNLKNKPLNINTFDQAKNYLEQDLTPIGDMRASKEYRLEIAKNLLMKCFIEINSNKLTRVN